VESFADVAALLGKEDELREEHAVVEGVQRELLVSPSSLAAASASWDEPYLRLSFSHKDGTVLTVTHGDGYTEISAGSVEYKGYLDPSSLVNVLAGAFCGQVDHVQQTRFGRQVGDYFELVGEERRLGYSQQLGAAPLLLSLLPFASEATHRTRLSFRSTPALADG
jgi:hypothetical protein